MNQLFLFCLLYLIFTISAGAASKLLLLTIEPGAIFGGAFRWFNFHSFLQRLRVSESAFFSKFLYKSLGGCSTCFAQRIAEFSFVAFVLVYMGYSEHWITNNKSMTTDWPWLTWLLRAFINIMVYILYCSMVFFWARISERRRPTRSIEKEYPEEKILRQNVN